MSMGAALKARRALAARHARRRGRNSLRVPGDRSAGAAHDVAARCSACTRCVRSHVPRLAGDRPPSPDIEAIAQMIDDGSLELSCALEVK